VHRVIRRRHTAVGHDSGFAIPGDCKYPPIEQGLYMEKERQPDRCDICGVEIGDDSAICAECERAFGPASPAEVTGDEPLIDLEQYCCRMFPWEQSRNPPRLVVSNKTWLILAIALAAIVILLALIRAPLPSCWEISCVVNSNSYIDRVPSASSHKEEAPGRNGNRSGQVENRPSLRPGSHLGQPLSVLDCTRREPRSESNYYSFPLQPVPGKTTLYNAGIYTAGKT